MRRPLLPFLLVVVSLLAAGCKPKPTAVMVEPESLKFSATGDAIILMPTVVDAKAKAIKHKPCAFASTDTSVAAVGQDGTVRSTGAGNAEIHVSCEGLSAIVPVKVRLPTTLALDLDCDKRCSLVSNSNPLSFKLEGLGAVAHLKAKVLDDVGEAVDTEVRFEVNDPEFNAGGRKLGVEIGNDGTVTAVAVGKFMILAQAGVAVGKANVEVVLPRVDVVKADRASLWIKPGEEAVLGATTYQRQRGGLKAVEGARLAWQTSDKSVATVDDDGHVKGVSPGNADLIVAADSGAFAQVDVKVDPAAHPEPAKKSVAAKGILSKKLVPMRMMKGKRLGR
jgi:uncharacterized protein YjdB